MKMLSVSAYISFSYCLGNITLFPNYCPGNLGNKISALFLQKYLTKMRGAWYNKNFGARWPVRAPANPLVQVCHFLFPNTQVRVYQKAGTKKSTLSGTD